MKKNYYTVVELLVVIVIMSIVAAIAFPGINRLINGNKVERAAKQLSAAIAKARSEAVVTNRKVALLFPVKHDSNNNVRNQYINSSYGIVILQRKFNDSDAWVADTEKNKEFKWERLPGNVFMSVTSGDFSSGSNFFSQGSIAEKIPQDFTITGTERRWNRIFKNLSTKTVKMLIFNPDGTIDNSSNLNFFFAEGIMASNGNIKDKEKASSDISGRPDDAIGFKLNRFTGRVKYYEEL